MAISNKRTHSCQSGGVTIMHAKCAECGGKIDCDDIICASCLAEIINKLYFNNQGISKKGRVNGRNGDRKYDFKEIKHSPA
ncbi:MAG: hypothetical protein PHQ86_09165 [Dehalococcoidales bacterium]|nr:hypothetical protein [Dehalococcoidales bacterium]